MEFFSSSEVVMERLWEQRRAFVPRRPPRRNRRKAEMKENVNPLRRRIKEFGAAVPSGKVEKSHGFGFGGRWEL